MLGVEKRPVSDRLGANRPALRGRRGERAKDRRMHRLTIAERVIAAAVLPLLVYFAARWLGAYLPLPDDDALAAFGPLALGLAAIALAAGMAYIVARSLSEPLVQAGETVDAM